MNKVLKIVGIVFKAILVALVALLLVYDVSAIVQKYVYKRDLPVFFGYTFAVVSSYSMSPTIQKNDLIIIDTDAEYGEGDVVTYYESSSGDYITHRIIAVNDGETVTYTTKGDNSDSADLNAVTDGMIVGKVVAWIGGVGAFISFIQQPIGMVLALAIIALAWILCHLVYKLLLPDKKDEE
ncbi:MAG: signal peptidase I [Clostridia bacterium]|nr:signal peptidase I [Clostridia bacterium]